ncbi:helix-turn-helix domain-containing protein [Kineococcus xinjiangensis]|nr:helix-turn-helix domain-containing protein [Kineococcus xinjiangensis]
MDSQQIAALTQKVGHPLTSSYISQLRRGSRTNPTIDSLRALAAVFSVPVSYFFPGEAEPDDQPPFLVGADDRQGGVEGTAPRPAEHRPSEVTSPVAAKLEELFERSRALEGGPRTVEDVARRCAELGYEVSAGYLEDMRSGVRDNPSLKAMEGIAKAFGVHISFFFSAPAGMESEQDVAQADRALHEVMRDEGIREIALRSSELDPAGRRILAAMLRELSDVKITRHEPTPPPPAADGE